MGAAPQLRLFDVGTGERLCPCCRKRYAIDGKVKCEACGGGKLRMCSKCGEKPASGKRKTCADCCGPPETYGKQTVFVSLPPEWKQKIENTQSGIRQRAQFSGSVWPKREDLAVILKQQSFRCAMSGELLNPSSDTVLGHRVPVSRGGSFAPSNLFWITREMNRMMKTMSDVEFRRLCERVVIHAG